MSINNSSSNHAAEPASGAIPEAPERLQDSRPTVTLAHRLQIALANAFINSDPATPLRERAERIYVAEAALMDSMSREWILDHLVSLLLQQQRSFVREHHGLISRIAEDCNVNGSLVSRVLQGTNTSARVSQAINTEIHKELERQKRWLEMMSSTAALSNSTEPQETGRTNP